MAVNTKAIKNRIKSVTNTKKITKAMELVSAAKMRKSVESALNTRTYATMARDLMAHLSGVEDKTKYGLLATRPVKNILMILISSNRGLCGSFNSNIARKAVFALQNKNELSKHILDSNKEVSPAGEVKVSILGIGKRSASLAKREGYELVGVYNDIEGSKDYEKVISISRNVIKDFEAGNYDKVVVAYTDYKTSLTQEPRIRQLLPISPRDLDEMLGNLGKNKNSAVVKIKDGTNKPRDLDEMLGNLGKNKNSAVVKIKDGTNKFDAGGYLFEPSEESILKNILPKLVEVQLYQSVLESSASEHSARMMAMRNASDAARDMINELNLTFNKARQASITQEIAEIAGGAAALE